MIRAREKNLLQQIVGGFASVIVTAFWLLSAAPPAWSQVVATWVGPGQGDWLVPNNWSCFNQNTGLVTNCVPNEITNPGTAFTVNIDNTTAVLAASPPQPVSIDALALGVNGSGGGLSLGNANNLGVQEEVDVGVTHPGSLTIATAGVLESVSAAIGLGQGSGGSSATVTGKGAQWDVNNEFDVGVNDKGELTILNGGQVFNGNVGDTFFIGGGLGITQTTGSGIVNVEGTASDGTPSELNVPIGHLFVGWPGKGTLTISGGGQVNDVQGVISNSPGAVGVVTVTGTGSQWNNSQFILVGSASGNATLTVSDGGVVNGGGDFIGVGPLTNSHGVGLATVSGTGSQWNSLFLGIGYGQGSQGTLTIENGGLVNDGSPGVHLGIEGAAGKASVVGAGSSWNIGGGLEVGFSGTGALTISNGGIVSATQSSIGYQSGSTGSVLVTGTGSGWNNSGSVDVGTAGAGTLTVSNGGEVTGTLITVGSNGILKGTGGTIHGDVSNSGLVSPGDPGLMTINGNYTQNPGGILDLLIAGDDPGQYDQLDITGNATFSGTIDLNFIDGFAPSAGETFDFINVDGTSNFDDVTLAISGLLPGFEYRPDFSKGLTLLAENNATPTPEPAASILLLLALATFGIVLRGRLGQAMNL